MTNTINEARRLFEDANMHNTQLAVCMNCMCVRRLDSIEYDGENKAILCPDCDDEVIICNDLNEVIDAIEAFFGGTTVRFSADPEIYDDPTVGISFTVSIRHDSDFFADTYYSSNETEYIRHFYKNLCV